MSKEWTKAQLTAITSADLGLDWEEGRLFDAVVDAGFDIAHYKGLTADDVMLYYGDINRFVSRYEDTIEIVCTDNLYLEDVETLQAMRCRYWEAAFDWVLYQVESYVEYSDPPAAHLDLEALLKGEGLKYQVGILTEKGLVGRGRLPAGEWELSLDEGREPQEAAGESDILVRELEGAEGEPYYVAISCLNGGDWLVVKCLNEHSMEETASTILYAIDRHFNA